MHAYLIILSANETWLSGKSQVSMGKYGVIIDKRAGFWPRFKLQSQLPLGTLLTCADPRNVVIENRRHSEPRKLEIP